MRTISILTAAYAPTAKYLPATIASVDIQSLPEGWQLEWIVQEDGPEPALAELVEHLPYVRYEANNAQLGLSQTRNLALSRVTGELLHVLDHDDVLLPGALTTLVPHFGAYPIHWAIGQADDLTPDGERVPYASALAYGLLAAGQVNKWAEDHGGNWPIHCAGLVMRTASVRALGGWVASPADDDVAMFAALSELADGYNEPTVTWLYRHHPEQTHRMAKWQAWSMVGRRISLQRAAAVRAAGLWLPADTRRQAGHEPAAVGPLRPKRIFPGT